MAFVTSNNTVISFAEYTDVLQRDQRLFEVNEGLSDDVVDPLLERATERILERLRSTNWWQTYWIRRQSSTISNLAQVPALDPDRIQSRFNDFTDLCVYTALADYVLPLVADFGSDESAERKKMGYYSVRADKLFDELVSAGDWYDFDNDNTIEAGEREQGFVNLKRIR